MTQPTPQNPTATEWYEQTFLPWKAQAEQYQADVKKQRELLRRNAPALQGIVAMLMDGATNRARLAWNALGLSPELAAIRISPDDETITLLPVRGAAINVTLTELMAGLQEIVES